MFHKNPLKVNPVAVGIVCNALDEPIGIYIGCGEIKIRINDRGTVNDLIKMLDKVKKDVWPNA